MMINGEKMPELLMSVIRFVVPQKDHTLKKLLILYWDVVEKKNAQGQLLSEFILVCNALRNDLTHPNEYVRGSTLRLLCKLKEAEILEPLLPSVRTNLEHRHSYVRRNAVLALYSIYKDFESLCPDAPELVHNFLINEGDQACKRNAFIMLFNCAQDRAIEYLNTVLDQVHQFGDILQFIVIDLIRKIVRKDPNQRQKYIPCIIRLLQSKTPAIQFEAAGALVGLSSSSTIVKASASTFINLLISQSDNNVKLVVLDRLLKIKEKHDKILSDLTMDVLKALVCPNMDIRQKILDFVMDLLSPKNIHEVVLVLKKEIGKTQSSEEDRSGEYRQMLVQAIHQCAVKFPDVAGGVIHVLMDLIGDENVASAVDVIIFVREVIEMYPTLRAELINRLIQSLTLIKSPRVYRAALWILGEYCTTRDEMDSGLTTVKEAIGEVPFSIESEETSEEIVASGPAAPTTVNAILPDGTYATQSALVKETPEKVDSAQSPTLRQLILGGDWFLCTSIANTLTKLTMKCWKQDMEQVIKNRVTAEVMLILTSILRLGSSSVSQNPIDPDSYERIVQCIRALTAGNDSISTMFLEACHSSFQDMLKANQIARDNEANSEDAVKEQPDALLRIQQLHGKKTFESVFDDDLDLVKATGAEGVGAASSNLNRVFQLTGFSDPIYAEAVVTVHQYDILLDIMVINQTGDTLQNVCLELATLGDLKLCERPQNYTIGPHNKKNITANIKVSSTDTGIIFGNIVYDIAGRASLGADRNCVILNDIHIDIMDYIQPATCTEVQFRVMWAEFEWENKVAVVTSITDVNKYLDHIVKATNMKCLTPPPEENCGILAANLYARSIFGEDALANIGIEKQPNGKISGFIRIRSKTQGIALSLGDKITLTQQREQEM